MKKSLIAFLISIVLIGIGISISVFEFMDFEYINEAPINHYLATVESYEIIPNSSIIKMDFNHQSDVRIEERNDIENIIVEITYYSEECKLIYDKLIYDNSVNEYDISFRKKNSNDKKLINNVIEDMKNKKVYNYSELFRGEVVIYTNSSHKNLISIKNAR